MLLWLTEALASTGYSRSFQSCLEEAVIVTEWITASFHTSCTATQILKFIPNIVSLQYPTRTWLHAQTHDGSMSVSGPVSSVNEYSIWYSKEEKKKNNLGLPERK